MSSSDSASAASTISSSQSASSSASSSDSSDGPSPILGVDPRFTNLLDVKIKAFVADNLAKQSAVVRQAQVKSQFRLLSDPTVDTPDVEEAPAGSSGGKAAKKAAAGKKASGRKGVSKPLTTLVEAGDPLYDLVVADFFKSYDHSKAEVETLLTVDNAPLWRRFSEYREEVEEANPVLARNGFTTVRAYHGTYFACAIGMDNKFEPCTLSECRGCQIIRNGFVLDPTRKNGRNQTPPFGQGFYFSLTAKGAQEYSTSFACPLGKRGRTAILACQVVTGKSCARYYTEGDDGTRTSAPDGYDSMATRTWDGVHGSQFMDQTVCVYNPHAAAVTQVLVYTHGSNLCPNCGIETNLPDTYSSVSDEYGTYHAEACRVEFTGPLVAFQKTITETAEGGDGYSEPFWAITNSEDNCILVNLWSGSKEFAIVSMMLRKTMSQGLSVARIYRVQNKHLHLKYYQERERVAAKNNGQANERLLFHGTSYTNPSEIYDTEDGFDFRFCSWGMWGRGSYFAVNASYSDNYAFTENNGYKTFFLAKVITGDAADIEPDSSLVLPPEKEPEKAQVTAAFVDANEGDDALAGVSGKKAAAKKAGKKAAAPKAAPTSLKGKKTEGGGASTSTTVKEADGKTAEKRKFKRMRYDSCTGETNGSRIYCVYAPPKAYPAYLITYKWNPYGY